MTTETARDLLARADQERRTADAVEMIGVNFRLGSALAVRRGLFGWRKSTDGWRELTAAESLALYRAAQIVRREALAEAERLEARVRTDGAA